MRTAFSETYATLRANDIGDKPGDFSFKTEKIREQSTRETGFRFDRAHVAIPWEEVEAAALARFRQ